MWCKKCTWKNLHKKLGAERSLFSQLHVFRGISYVHVLDQERSKIDDKSEKYVFIDYNSSFKGYKLYNPSARKVIVIRNVEFDEEGTWNWTTQ